MITDFIRTSISNEDVRQGLLPQGDPAQRQILQPLQENIAGGDLNAARPQYQGLRDLFRTSATVNGASPVISTQLSTRPSTWSSALSSGNLTTFQSAFTTFLKGLNVFG
jgi:hypothetical protein